ncbi:MAG: site-specific integrase [Pyrinomonadaceae bacterium]|nr:site-specific integrase [Pyrinomonadaceae bacterium]
MKEFYGKRLLNEITTESLRSYKMWRLKRKSQTKKDATVKLTTVNRDLSVMRKMMRYAYGKGWVLRDIFFNAGVIDVSHETARTRLLTREEENRLLNSCQGERQITYERTKKNNPNEVEEIEATISVDNPHLKGMILLALDSGMRRGEILKLRWQDIDFDNNVINIIGTHTKTERPRIAPLTQRSKVELEKLKEISKGENPFPYVDIKRSFATAKRIAGLNDLRFHDLRRTAITRWLQNNTPLAIAGKFAGHSQLQTTMKHYTATDLSMAQEINEKLNAFNLQPIQPMEEQTQIHEQIENDFLN